MRALPLVLVLLALLLGAGCEGLFATQECITDPDEAAIDPKTGACTHVSNSDGCAYCYGESDPCIVGTVEHLNYASCRNDCSSATEADCVARPDCRAAYADDAFFACLATPPKSVFHSGACDRLDAYLCSLHDNCAAHYASHVDGTRSFDHCADENP
ncbi:MAG TPA: hypothetical protein VLM79_11505 [Kofleriaceae bacterium]|nr:hypothetical protein [Kofleriaceae bacterium]